MRIGAKGRPFYRIVVVDERKKRTGSYLDLIGTYNPLSQPKEIKIDQVKVDSWVKKGAQLSDGFLRITKQNVHKPERKVKNPGKYPEPAAPAPVAQEAPAEETATTEESVTEETSENEVETVAETATTEAPVGEEATEKVDAVEEAESVVEANTAVSETDAPAEEEKA